MITGSSFIFSLPRQFQRCDQRRNIEAKQCVYPLDVLEFVGIGQMAAVPSQKKVALVERCQGKMQSIAHRISWHNLVLDVGLHDLDNLLFNRNQRQGLDQGDGIGLIGVIPMMEFIQHSFAGYQLIGEAASLPPFTGLLAPSEHVGFLTSLDVEAGNCCFDVHDRD